MSDTNYILLVTKCFSVPVAAFSALRIEVLGRAEPKIDRKLNA